MEFLTFWQKVEIFGLRFFKKPLKNNVFLKKDIVAKLAKNENFAAMTARPPHFGLLARSNFCKKCIFSVDFCIPLISHDFIFSVKKSFVLVEVRKKPVFLLNVLSLA